MASRNAITDAQRIVKVNKKACLENLCNLIHKKVLSNNGRMPYGYMNTLLEENKKSFHWLTRDVVNSAYTRFKKMKKKSLEITAEAKKPTINEVHIDQHTTETSSNSMSSLHHCNNDTSTHTGREKGGRPSGSSSTMKRKRELEIIKMKERGFGRRKLMVKI